MRHDEPSPASSPLPTTENRPPVRALARVWLPAMAVLMVLTSLAVASVSPWLVPLYLVLMVLVLVPTGPPRDERGELSGRESGHESDVESAADRGTSEAGAGSTAVPEVVAEVGDNPASDSEPVAVKTRRGKGRARKKSGAGPLDATWVRVGPGKFVRIEGPDPSAVGFESSSESEVARAAEDGLATREASEGAETQQADPGGGRPTPLDEGDGEPQRERVGEVIAEDVSSEPAGLGIATIGRGEASEDNGIAPDAFDPARTAEAEVFPPTDIGEDGLSLFLPHDLGTRSTFGASSIVARGASPWPGPTTRRGRSSVSSWRSNRPGRVSRSLVGARPFPVPRGASRFRRLGRSFPPRSPPLPLLLGTAITRPIRVASRTSET